MSTRFITILEAAKMTNKSRRTIQRLVQTLAKEQPDQVMQERTSRGYMWKISMESVQAYRMTNAPADVAQPATLQPTHALHEASSQHEKYMEVALQGYAGLMAMHQEVKQVYEQRLKDKDQRITELTSELELIKQERVMVPTPEIEQSRSGLWGWLFGG